MDVPQLLDAFVLSPHIEVVETVLLHVSRPSHGPQSGWVPAARDAQNAAGESELEGLHDGGGSAALRLADQQMKMLGHHSIAQNHESVALSGLF
jgi:hypothetical protein